jgi:hypothetical protein
MVEYTVVIWILIIRIFSSLIQLAVRNIKLQLVGVIFLLLIYNGFRIVFELIVLLDIFCYCIELVNPKDYQNIIEGNDVSSVDKGTTIPVYTKSEGSNKLVTSFAESTVNSITPLQDGIHSISK